MKKIARQLILDYIENYNLDRSILWFVRTVGLSSDDVRIIAERRDCKRMWFSKDSMAAGEWRYHNSWWTSRLWIGRIYRIIIAPCPE